MVKLLKGSAFKIKSINCVNFLLFLSKKLNFYEQICIQIAKVKSLRSIDVKKQSKVFTDENDFKSQSFYF